MNKMKFLLPKEKKKEPQALPPLRRAVPKREDLQS